MLACPRCGARLFNLLSGPVPRTPIPLGRKQGFPRDAVQAAKPPRLDGAGGLSLLSCCRQRPHPKSLAEFGNLAPLLASPVRCRWHAVCHLHRQKEPPPVSRNLTGGGFLCF